MSLLEAIILGIIQGLTEFIPISSSGHLIIAEKLMGIENRLSAQQITAFVAVMQLGTLAAVLVYFFSDIVSISLGFVKDNIRLLQGSKDNSARKASRLGWMIIIGTLPIAIVGILAKKAIEGDFTKNLFVIGISMIVWAILLGFAERVGRRRSDMEHIGVREASFIGITQVFALIPGSSRSGTTIAGGLFAGLTREAAARFSFLLSIPAIAASGLLELKEALALLSGTSMVSLGVATAVSAVVGYASIAFLISYLRNHTTFIFIIYRLIAGVVVIYLAFKKFR
ncbi:MAG TPA: undecaprenyl-diphosphatase UppP [Blastocatellia bacterium]|nr:undecaprenyl-diphosphatase UppP [Blastocatellia bacterium]